MQTISKSRFKPKALQYSREIQETGHEIIISDRGKPVVKIIPFSENSKTVLEELKNSVI